MAFTLAEIAEMGDDIAVRIALKLAERKDWESVMTLLAHGVSSTKNVNRRSLGMSLWQDAPLSVLRQALKDNPSLLALGSRGAPVVSQAILRGDHGLLEDVLNSTEISEAVMRHDDFKVSPFGLAAWTGNEDALRLLAAKGKTSSPVPPLLLAIAGGADVAVVSFLLEWSRDSLLEQRGAYLYTGRTGFLPDNLTVVTVASGDNWGVERITPITASILLRRPDVLDILLASAPKESLLFNDGYPEEILATPLWMATIMGDVAGLSSLLTALGGLADAGKLFVSAAKDDWHCSTRMSLQDDLVAGVSGSRTPFAGSKMDANEKERVAATIALHDLRQSDSGAWLATHCLSAAVRAEAWSSALFWLEMGANISLLPGLIADQTKVRAAEIAILSARVQTESRVGKTPARAI